MPNARNASSRFLGSQNAGIALLQQKLAGRADLQSINLSSQLCVKIPRIQRKQPNGPRCQRCDDNRTILCLRKNKRFIEGNRIQHKTHSRFDLCFPSECRSAANLGQIFACFVRTPSRTHQLPTLCRRFPDEESRSAPCRTCRRKQHTGVEEQPHLATLLPAALNASISASSRAIHARIFALGISRTGNAIAGCKNNPPSRSSTNTIGLGRASSPSFRRISGGNVSVPRLERGRVVVMRQYCIAASETQASFPNPPSYQSPLFYND